MKKDDNLIKKKPFEYDCIIAIPSSGDCGFLLSRTPNLDDFFDGTSLEDNISSNKLNTIPKEPGVYRCKILVMGLNVAGFDEPDEFEWDVWITKPKKILSY
jgi:hypothetical protein